MTTDPTALTFQLRSTALNGGARPHTHPESDVDGLVAALAAKAATSHTHSESDVTSLTTDLAAKPKGRVASVGKVVNATPPTCTSTTTLVMVTGLSDLSVTIGTGRRYAVRVSVPWSHTTSGAGIRLVLLDGGGSAPTTGSTAIDGTYTFRGSTNSNGERLTWDVELDPNQLSAGTHRLGLAFRSAGTASTSQVTDPNDGSYFRVEDIGA
jgi:hypothetical protein